MKIAYCIKCGNKFPEEAVFCPYCGAKIFRPEDAKTDLKPEEVIVEIPTEPIVTEPASKQKPTVEAYVPKNDDVVPPAEPIITEPIVQEDTRIDEPSPVEEKTDEFEAVIAPEEDATPDVIVEPDTPVDEDELEDPKIGVCILAFFFPIVGFIAAASNRGTNKKKAKTYSMWAWIGFGLGFISKMISATI